MNEPATDDFCPTHRRAHTSHNIEIALIIAWVLPMWVLAVTITTPIALTAGVLMLATTFGYFARVTSPRRAAIHAAIRSCRECREQRARRESTGDTP
jgi:hypothetical protein